MSTLVRENWQASNHALEPSGTPNPSINPDTSRKHDGFKPSCLGPAKRKNRGHLLRARRAAKSWKA